MLNYVYRDLMIRVNRKIYGELDLIPELETKRL